LPRRQPPSAVTSSLARASLLRSATASALKPPNTTLWVAPMRAQASMATASSGTMGMYSVTRSPGRMPRPLSALANLHTSWWSIS